MKKETFTYTDAAASLGGRTAEAVQKKKKTRTGSYAAAVSDAGTGESGASAAGSTPSYADIMEKYYAGEYESALADNERAAKRTAESAERSAHNAVERIRDSYRSTDRALYRKYMENLRTIAQRLAAQGLTGGVTESSRMRLADSYGEGIAENARARLGEEADAYASRDERIAEAEAAREKSDAEARKTQSENHAALREKQEDRRREDAQKIAALLASAGDYLGYLQLGLTKEQAEFLKKAFGK